MSACIQAAYAESVRATSSSSASSTSSAMQASLAYPRCRRRVRDPESSSNGAEDDEGIDYEKEDPLYKGGLLGLQPISFG